MTTYVQTVDTNNRNNRGQSWDCFECRKHRAGPAQTKHSSKLQQGLTKVQGGPRKAATSHVIGRGMKWRARVPAWGGPPCINTTEWKPHVRAKTPRGPPILAVILRVTRAQIKLS